MGYEYDPNHHDPQTLLGRVRAVLWYSWDPLETSGIFGAPDDEYDSYGPTIVKLVTSASSVATIASHLSRIQTKRMNCRDTPERNRRVAAQLRACVAVGPYPRAARASTVSESYASPHNSVGPSLIIDRKPKIVGERACDRLR